MDNSAFYHLIDKHLAGSLTTAEQDQLKALMRDDESAKLLDELMEKQLMESTVTQQDYPLITDRISGRLRKEIRVIRIRRLWWAAAAIMLLFTAGAYLWQQAHQRKDFETAVADVDPGYHKAMLTLSDGSTVPLDSAGVQVIKQGGTAIRQAGGQLQYDVEEDGAAIGYNTLSTPRGGQFQVTLPDGSQVWLNAASSLKYPTAFTGKERLVVITGEAYFEIAADAKRPFRIKAGKNTEIEVLGTHFNVNAYEDETSLLTTLLQGAVRVNAQPLKPGQQAAVQASTGEVSIRSADISKVMAWRYGLFNFQDAHLKEVMRQLARWYDIEVVYEQNVPDIEFVGELSRNVKLSELLRGLKGAGVHFRLEEGRRVVVMP